MINRIKLNYAQYLYQPPGEDKWYLCLDSANSLVIIRELNVFENVFINSAINATVQEAWIWAGGNPEIPATSEELRFALETLDQIAEEAEEHTNPLLTFAKEVLIGAYRPEELSDAAMKAIDYFRMKK